MIQQSDLIAATIIVWIHFLSGKIGKCSVDVKARAFSRTLRTGNALAVVTAAASPSRSAARYNQAQLGERSCYVNTLSVLAVSNETRRRVLLLLTTTRDSLTLPIRKKVTLIIKYLWVSYDTWKVHIKIFNFDFSWHQWCFLCIFFFSLSRCVGRKYEYDYLCTRARLTENYVYLSAVIPANLVK